MGSLKVRAALAAVAVALTAGLAVTPAAAAPAYVTGVQYYGAESAVPSAGATAFVQLNAAATYSRIWLSGSVHCPAFNGAHTTWCGWIGNGTNHAQGGVNYTVGGGSYWMRLDIYAPIWNGVSIRCVTRGNTVNFVTYCAGRGN